MKRMLLVLSLVVGVVSSAHAGSLSLVLSYPGFGLEYQTGKNCFELRAGFSSSVQAFGLRFSYLLKNLGPRLNALVGLEVDYLSFRGKRASGSGLGGIAFGGILYSLGERLSIGLDLGPGLVSLLSRPNVISFDIVINASLKYRFLGKN